VLELKTMNLNIFSLEELKGLEKSVKKIADDLHEGVVQKMEEALKNSNGGEKSECVICMDAKCEMICLPCGHMAMCEKCSVQFSQGKLASCPMCRGTLTQVLKVYK